MYPQLAVQPSVQADLRRADRTDLPPSKRKQADILRLEDHESQE